MTARFGTIYTLATDLYWTGDSLAALRIHDVLRALDMAQSLSCAETAQGIKLYTHGRYSVYALLAAKLDPRIRTVETVDGLDSLSDWVRSCNYDPDEMNALIVPGMLQYLDI